MKKLRFLLFETICLLPFLAFSQWNQPKYNLEGVQAVACERKFLGATAWQPQYPITNGTTDVFLSNSISSAFNFSAQIVGELSAGAKIEVMKVLEASAKITARASAEMSLQGVQNYGSERKITIGAYQQARYARYGYVEKYIATVVETGKNQYGQSYTRRIPVTYLKEAITRDGYDVVDVIEIKKGNQVTSY